MKFVLFQIDTEPIILIFSLLFLKKLSNSHSKKILINKTLENPMLFNHWISAEKKESAEIERI